MANVFLSYSRQDLVTAQLISNGLQADGHHVWMDVAAISGGEQWQTRIVQAISNSDALLLLLSKNSVTSEQIRRELAVADSRKIRIIPIATDELQIPEHLLYVLAGLHIIYISQNIEEAISSISQTLPAPERPNPHVERGVATSIPKTTGSIVTPVQELPSFPDRAKASVVLATIGAVVGLSAYKFMVAQAEQSPGGGINISQFVIEPALPYALVGATLGALGVRTWIILLCGLLASFLWQLTYRPGSIVNAGHIEFCFNYALLYSGNFSLALAATIVFFRFVMSDRAHSGGGDA